MFSGSKSMDNKKVFIDDTMTSNHKVRTARQTTGCSKMMKTLLMSACVTATLATMFSAQTAAADVATQEPFMWMDTGAPAPTASRPQESAPYGQGKYGPGEIVYHDNKYTPQDGGKYTPESSAMAHSNCYYPDGRPVTLDFPYGPMMENHPGYAGHAYDVRRGYMAGDDGILRGIQDNPCVEIYRRGGETPESAAGWLHPHDIRRVNTLENRRIPIHKVGRYDPNGESLWYTDPAQPYSDAAQTWDVREGELLSQLLKRWGAESGWTVVFQSPADFILQANVTVRGTFTEAAGEVVESFSDARPPLTAEFYTGNRVLVIRTSAEFDDN